MVLKTLVMSLQGSDKTMSARTLKQHLTAVQPKIGVDWQNADCILEQLYAMDFSGGGRLRQSEEIAKITYSLLRPHPMYIELPNKILRRGLSQSVNF